MKLELTKALWENASSRTRKYFLNTEEGRLMTANFCGTIECLLCVDFEESIEAHNGALFDQSDYKVIGNLPKLWRASRVYASPKDLTRKRNPILSYSEIGIDHYYVTQNGYLNILLTDSGLKKVKDAGFDVTKDLINVQLTMLLDGRLDRETDVPEISILTPVEVDTFIDRYNENQASDKQIEAVSLDGVKGVTYYDLQGFVTVDRDSIVEGNPNGTIDSEVSVLLRYECQHGSPSIIDEVDERAVSKWLLSKKSTT